jgi:hypothetical protein
MSFAGVQEIRSDEQWHCFHHVDVHEICIVNRAPVSRIPPISDKFHLEPISQLNLIAIANHGYISIQIDVYHMSKYA